MAADLFWLVCTAVLSVTIPLVYVVGRTQGPGGLAWGFGNRDTAIAAPAWAERAFRAHANLTENLTAFAILVLTAHAAGKSGDATALGAMLFFWARLAHFVVYTAGIVYVRTLAFFAAMVGEIMILLALFR